MTWPLEPVSHESVHVAVHVDGHVAGDVDSHVVSPCAAVAAECSELLGWHGYERVLTQRACPGPVSTAPVMLSLERTLCHGAVTS